MRARTPILLALLLLAGCATPGGPGAATGPIDLTGKLGLLAIDTTTRAVTVLSETAGGGWMSQSGSHVAWLEQGYGVLLDSVSGARDVVPATAWTTLYDNGTGLDLDPGAARWRDVRSGDAVGNATLPPAPQGGAWATASDDLRVLGAEYAGARQLTCTNDLYVLGATSARTVGCHLRIARDGRAGWTENGGVRVRGLDGTVQNMTATGGGDVASNSYISYENPVFTSQSVAYLQLTGGRELTRSEIHHDGAAVAKMDGPRRIALLDVSEDGRFYLVRAFDRS